MGTRQLKKAAKETQINKELELSTTLVGSIVASVGILSGKTFDECHKLFRTIKKEVKEDTSVMNLTKRVLKDFEIPNKELLSRLILVYDNNEIYTPLVAITTDNEDVMPIARNGRYYGVLTQLNKPTTGYEFLFDENGDEYEDDTSASS